MGSLSEDEFKNACPRHSEVQGLTNEAAAGARADRTDWSQQGFGTEVHKRVERAVNGTDKQTGESRSPDNPQDKNFVAEFSAWKIKVADAAARAAGYGDKDTIRVDVLENVRGHRTVCVYDIKTGERGLRPGRIKEIVGAVMKHFGNDNNIIRIIIAEVRPKP